MGSEKTANPGCRRAGFGDLDAEVDQQFEIVLETAERARLDQLEEADIPQRRYVLLRHRAVSFRGAGGRLEAGVQAADFGDKPIGCRAVDECRLSFPELCSDRHSRLLVRPSDTAVPS